LNIKGRIHPSLDKVTEENATFETATKAFIPIGPEKIEFSCLKKEKEFLGKLRIHKTILFKISIKE